DSRMIESLKIMTIEESPRIVTLSGDDTGLVLHSWGTTGIIIEAQLKLVPAETWIDCIATFPTYADVIAFGNAAFDSDLDIFLLSAVERRFAPYYKRLNAYFDGSRDAMFSMVKESAVDRYFALAAGFDGHRSMRLNDIMRSFEEDGCVLNNPHIFKLEDGGRFDPDGRKLAFRKSVDPMGLLNPGKLRSLS